MNAYTRYVFRSMVYQGAQRVLGAEALHDAFADCKAQVERAETDDLTLQWTPEEAARCAAIALRWASPYYDGPVAQAIADTLSAAEKRGQGQAIRFIDTGP